MKIERVTKKSPCPVCRRGDWCGRSADGGVAICMRVASDRQLKHGGWLHRLTDAMPSPLPIASPVVTTSPTASPDKLDRVYSSLLGLLTLSAFHRSSLESRGLSPQAIEANLYRSNPSRAYAETVCRTLGDVEGVPGFYYERGWRMSDYGPGFFIPVRDSKGRIRGLQFRKDEGSPKYLWLSSASKNRGASSGAPLHFAKAHLINPQQKVIITEGSLKADVIADRLDRAVVGMPGVSHFPDHFALKLFGLFPSLEDVYIAFDSDWRTNRAVKSALIKLIREIRTAKCEPHILRWSPRFKGFDDYLVAA